MTDSALNELQVEVLCLFFALPESDGFILAGGAGLIAVGLSTRPTEDLDLFTAAASVRPAGDALEHAAIERGWSTDRIQESPTFRRIVISIPDAGQVVVDLAQDAGPLSAVMITTAGPAYPPEELAARKVLALFDRAALRDFVDVANVASRFGRSHLVDLAATIDEGFNLGVLTDMLGTLDRFTDDEIRPITDPAALRAFFADWIDRLRDEL